MRALHEQVVVVTGASSGIGRETALRFARKGARVVLAARGDQALYDVARDIETMGGLGHVVVMDVSDYNQMEHLVESAINRFGRIDTWVNNAGIGQYGYFEDMTVEEIDQLLRTNLHSQLYGIKAALPYLRQEGGTIINVSSVAGARAVPLLAVYSASKHGVKGFSDALRLEMQHKKTGVHVTTIFPSAVNTPFLENARSTMGVEPQPMPPAYPAALVADAILYAATHPKRDIYVGGAGKMLSVLDNISGGMTDFLLTRGGFIFKAQKSRRLNNQRDSMFAPSPTVSNTVEGSYKGLTMPGSVYTRLFEIDNRWQRLVVPLAGLALLVGRVISLRRMMRPAHVVAAEKVRHAVHDVREEADSLSHRLRRVNWREVLHPNSSMFRRVNALRRAVIR